MIYFTINQITLFRCVKNEPYIVNITIKIRNKYIFFTQYLVRQRLREIEKDRQKNPNIKHTF